MPTDSVNTRDYLKDILALNRAMEYIERNSNHGILKGLDADQTKEKIESLQFEIHREIYRDTAKTDAAVAVEASRLHPKRSVSRAAISEFVNKIYDVNGSVVRLGETPQEDAKELSKAFAGLYEKLGKNGLFNENTRRVLDTLMVLISNSKAFQEVHATKLDFRRLTRAECEILNQCFTSTSSSHQQALESIFEHALDASKTPHLNNGRRAKTDGEIAKLEPGEPFPSWPDQRVMIADIPFLKHSENGQEYLVTVNGGLVPYNAALEKIIIEALVTQSKRLDELDLSSPELKIEKYLLGFENPVINGVVDGFEIKNGQAPLLCLGANIITGLRGPNHDEFEAFWKKEIEDIAREVENGDAKQIAAAKRAGWTRFADDKYANKLLERVNGNNDHLRGICEVALKHIKHIVHQLDTERDKQLKLGRPVANDQKPLLIMSMGGAGSGKSGAEEMIKTATNNNFVKASLDEYRNHSGIYKVLQAANHHMDDYRLVEPFANAMRDWVRNGALENNMNLYYDGTAIPFDRCNDLLKQAKAGNYTTVVAAYDTALHLPEHQRDAIDSSALERVVARKRKLPIPVVTTKHTQTLGSIIQAYENPLVDRLMVFCKDGEEKKEYLLADAFTVTQTPELTKPTVEGFSSLRDQSNKDLALSSDLQKAIGEACKNTIPYYDNEHNNLSHLLTQTDKTKRVMLINNNYRFIQLAEKALMNTSSSSPDGLLQKHSGLAMDVPQNIGKDDALNTTVKTIELPQAYLNEVIKVTRPEAAKIVAI